jgi:exopolyphosphatase/guanosine-5'-triphosphate,3'-diphosphate pyrophosphatase
MRIGIVDLGSNSIRLVIFDQKGSKLTKELNIKHTAKSVLYIKDRIMSSEGISVIVKTLKELKFISDVYAPGSFEIFATASLRNIDNSSETVKTIEELINYPINLLSGYQEAKFGFDSLINNNENNGEGLLIDIGGGSIEITHFKNDKLINTDSIPYGSLLFYTTHVSNILPNNTEQKVMREFISDQFKSIKWLSNLHVDKVVGIGGSSRALLKVAKELEYYYKTDNKVLDKETVQSLSRLNQSHSKAIIKSVPDRLTTMIPGAIIIDELLKHTQASEFIISSSSVREGFILQHLNED